MGDTSAQDAEWEACTALAIAQATYLIRTEVAKAKRDANPKAFPILTSLTVDFHISTRS
jgi:hypothetical protein